MTAWEDAIARQLRALRLDHTRNQILVLVALAAGVPAVTASVGGYRQRRRSLDDRVARELLAASAVAARETNRWLDDRLADLRRSASSYVVIDNVGQPQGRAAQVARLREYLGSVRERSAGHEAVLIVEPRGRTVASSGRTTGVRLSPDALNTLRTRDAFVGDPFWDAGRAVLPLAVPIRQADGSFLGAFTAKLRLEPLADQLHETTANPAHDVGLITEKGQPVLRAQGITAEAFRMRLPDTTTRALFEGAGRPVAYPTPDRGDVIAALQPVPSLGWGAVAEISRAEVNREARGLRNGAVVAIIMLMVAIGLLAFGLALYVARPLERLVGAAAKVAAGDVSTEFPAGSRGEVGYLERVFTTLLGRLRERESQGELERLSVTDSLTGLYNRRHLMGTLATEVQRSRRMRRTFCVLLADVDHFKQYNDTHGHLAGDAALVKVAELLRKATRGVDSVARYGGEEFVIMLLETSVTTAAQVSERIRARIAEEAFGPGRLTVSIGVAEYPERGDTPEELIASADAAMYQAKSGGRNRVVIGAMVVRDEPPAPVKAGVAEVKEEKKRRRKGETS